MSELDEMLRSAPPVSLDGIEVCRTLLASPSMMLRADAADDEDGSGDEQPVMFGHFSVFNEWYEINSWWEGNFLERIAPGAFKRTIKNRTGQSPVRVLLDHGYDPQLGDKPLGVPSVLEERDQGAYAEVPLFRGVPELVVDGLRNGAYGQSFRFVMLRDEMNEEPEASDYNPKGLPERTIKEVRLIEFGPTPFPASPTTDAGVRAVSTTDDFYARLRRRDPDAYERTLARVRAIRLPQTPTTTTEDPPVQRHSEDPPPPVERHSEDPPATVHSRPPVPIRKETLMDPMTIEERAARQSEIRARFDEIDSEYAGGEITDPDVQTEWDELTAEYDEHERAIAAQERRREDIARRAENAAATEQARTAPAVTRRPENIYDLAEIRQQARSVDDLPRLYRDAAMRAVEQARFPGVKNRERAQAQVAHLLDRVDDENGTLARKILVTGSPTYDRAFGKMAMALSVTGLTAEEQRALALGSDAAGGFAVPFQLDPTIILDSDGVIDPLRQIARVEQIVGKEWQGVTSGAVTVSRSAEAAEVGDQTPTLDQPTVKANRVTGFIPFSLEIEADWPAMRNEMTMLLNDAKATEEAGSFVNGDGTGVNAGGIIGTLDAASNVTANAFSVGTVYALEESLGPRYRANARWLANRSVYNASRQLDTSGGANLWVQLGAGLPPTLIGYPTHEASEMVAAAAGTIGDRYLLFGDFRHFLIVDRVGMTVELVPHLFATTNNRPSGQRGLLAVWRNNSAILVDNAFRVAHKAA